MWVIYDTKIGRMPMHCHQTPRSANSILACTLKRRQPRLEAPFSTWIHNCCGNIAKIFQMPPTFREGQLIYELWPWGKSWKRRKRVLDGIPRLARVYHGFARQNTPPLRCKCLLILVIKRHKFTPLSNKYDYFNVFLPILGMVLYRKGINHAVLIGAISTRLSLA